MNNGRHKISLLPILSFLLFFGIQVNSNSVEAQVIVDIPNSIDTSLIYKVTQLNGKYHIGKIIQINERNIIMYIPGKGELTFAAHKLLKIEATKPDQFDKDGAFIAGTDMPSIYVLNANAIGPRKGEVELGMHWVGPDATFGISNRLSLRVATTWIAVPAGMTLNYQIPISKKFNTSIGLMGSWGTWREPNAKIILPYASFTFGSADKNISFNFGFGKRDDRYSLRGDIPYTSLSFIAPISSSWSIVFDSYLTRVTRNRRNISYNPEPSEITYYSYRYSTGMALLAFRAKVSDKQYLQFGGGIIGQDWNFYPLPVIEYFYKFN